MSLIIQVLATYAPWIYAACGLVALYQIYRILLVRAERRQAVFSLEREKAVRDLYRIFSVALILLLVMGATYFFSTTLSSAVEPLVVEALAPTPNLPFVPTPTNTPEPTPTTPGNPVPPTPTNTPEPTPTSTPDPKVTPTSTPKKPDGTVTPTPQTVTELPSTGGPGNPTSGTDPLTLIGMALILGFVLFGLAVRLGSRRR